MGAAEAESGVARDARTAWGARRAPTRDRPNFANDGTGTRQGRVFIALPYTVRYTVYVYGVKSAASQNSRERAAESG